MFKLPELTEKDHNSFSKMRRKTEVWRSGEQLYQGYFCGGSPVRSSFWKVEALAGERTKKSRWTDAKVQRWTHHRRRVAVVDASPTSATPSNLEERLVDGP